MKKIHFMGIGGVGMAGVAFLLKKAGYEVSGCDKYATPRTRWLEANGIPVSVGHDPSHLDGIDELIITPAVPKDAPERARAEDLCARQALTVRFRGEVLADLVNDTFGIAICGTHGKTTTSTFTTKLLTALGDAPAWCIGGETGALPVAGSPDAAPTPRLVVEADESDGTLALYRAQILVVMNMDYDHPEHFPTEAAYRACYEKAMSQAAQVVKAWELDASDYPELPTLVNGAHNVVNARAAIEVALRLGHTPDDIRAVLPEVLSELPDRRFQRIWPRPDETAPNHARLSASFTVITDYAHHPRELACAVAMAADLQPRRLRVLFQPHRYTRTQALCPQFPPAFAAADEVILIPVYAAFEQPLPGGDIADLYKAFREGGSSDVHTHRPTVKLARSALEAWRHVYLTREPGDLILLAGAGDIIQLLPRVQADLDERDATPTPPVTRLLGAGTNTWRSDLATDERFVRTTGPAAAPGATLGIPWMAGIPGTLGGWVKMNAGAFGHSISEVIRRVKVDGQWRARAACGFAYRHSDIAGEIQDVEFDFTQADFPDPLRPENKSALAALCADYQSRRRKFPAGTKGSVFKNPSGNSSSGVNDGTALTAGRLLEEAGAKALRVGGAYVWQEHANVIVAGPDATASDFLALARLMARAVFFKHGIRLEPEVCGLAVWP